MGTISQWLAKTYQLILFGRKKSIDIKQRKTTRRSVLGLAAEDQALEFLKTRGLLLLERNYYSRWGEIDLIMDDCGTVTFIEVRYRTKLTHGIPQETVNQIKAKKMIKTAQAYLQQQKGHGKPCRFDVVAISATQTGSQHVEWIKHAIEDTENPC